MRYILSILVLTLAWGCQHKHPAPIDAASLDPQDRFTASIPAGWQKAAPADKDTLLTLHKGAAEINIIVPKMPAHIPGLIPLPAVEKGYIDDARQRLNDVQKTNSREIGLDGYNARRFTFSGTGAHGPRQAIVIAAAKGDTLYLITGESPGKDFAPTESAVDALAASWKWKKE